MLKWLGYFLLGVIMVVVGNFVFVIIAGWHQTKDSLGLTS